MKKLFSILLITSMLLSLMSAFSFNVSADYPKAEDEAVMNGYENLCLTYTYNPNAANNGRHLPEDLKPYVGYYGVDGQLKDFFFDSYLFLPCVTYGVSGARLHYDVNQPTKAEDWIAYVNDTFAEGANVDALEVAFGEAKTALNDNDRKAGVVLTILYPADNQTDFGSLGGKNLDFTKLEDRKLAIKWIIDEQLKLYNENGYKNLELIGFYWLEEYLVTTGDAIENKQLYQYAADYLHSLGLKFVWIPWFRSHGYKQWKELGFDIACMQPNMYWEQIPTENRVTDTADECKSLGMGVEIEIDGRALASAEYYNRYLDYLEGCMNRGAMNSVKMYYQDAKSGIYYKAWKSTDERSRSIYDLTYKYAKGTLTQADIDSFRSPEFELPKDVKWRSNGKKYTATPAYFDGNGAGYQNIDGKELTDGIIGASELDTEWHGFHKSILDPDGRMSVTVDLSAIYKDLTHFIAHFSHIENYGIDDPADVKIEISTDGENFTTIATPEIQTHDIAAYVSYHCEPVTARYVKFSFINSNANFVFCSEVLVGAGEAPTNTPEASKPESVEGNESQNGTESVEGTESEDVSEASVTDKNEADSQSNWYIWVIAAALLIVCVVVFLTIKKSKKQ